MAECEPGRSGTYTHTPAVQPEEQNQQTRGWQPRPVNQTTHTRSRRFHKKPEHRRIQRLILQEAITEDQKLQVVNLSDVTLSISDYSLLAKGLSFCPTPPPPNIQTSLLEIENFHRRLRLVEHFHDPDEDINPTDEPDKPYPFRQKSNWTPPRNANLRLEAYIKANNIELESQYPIKQLHSNLSKDDNSSLIKLKMNKTIIIKPADKGGALVVINRTDYLTEANRQLNDLTHYSKLRLRTLQILSISKSTNMWTP